MQILKTCEELAAWRETVPGTLGLVMIMRALYEGHLELVRAAQDFANTVLVTVFVNPTQSAPGEDFETYPHDLESDAGKLRQESADALLALTPEVTYPEGEAQVRFDPGPAAKVPEGKARPTRFAGVLLVVGKIFRLIRPDTARFDRKDAQQLATVTQMMKGLDSSVQIVPVEICREEDDLAMSSRNRYLSITQRETVLELSRSLQWGVENAEEYGSQALASVVHERLAAVPGIEVDYVALVDSEGYVPIIQAGYHGKATLVLTAKVGSTRLIDNVDLWMQDTGADTS